MNEEDAKLRDKLALRITEILLEKGFDNLLRQTNFFEFLNSNPVKLANMMVSGKTLSFDDIQEFVHGTQPEECCSSSNECCEDTSTSKETPFDKLFKNPLEDEVGYDIEPIPSINNVPCGKGGLSETRLPTLTFLLSNKNKKLSDGYYQVDKHVIDTIVALLDQIIKFESNVER